MTRPPPPPPAAPDSLDQSDYGRLPRPRAYRRAEGEWADGTEAAGPESGHPERRNWFPNRLGRDSHDNRIPRHVHMGARERAGHGGPRPGAPPRLLRADDV